MVAPPLSSPRAIPLHRQCLFPQELGLTMPQRTHLTGVRILMHESMIASRVEIFITDTRNLKRVASLPLQSLSGLFRRLGYVPLLVSFA